jgi:hypothetical protein
MLSAPVPRNLRVRSSIQISSMRVPARAFLIVAGLIFCGGLLIVGGADLMRTVRLTGALILIGLAVFELRCWGRSMREVAQILIHHGLRRKRLRLDRVMLTLPPETSAGGSVPRPRWQT